MVNILIYLRKLYHKGIHGNISVCGKKLKFISLLFQWVARSPSACRPCLLKWSSAWDRREPKHEGERSGSRLILPVGGQIDKFNSDLTEKGSWFLTLEEIKVIPLKLGKAVRIYQKCLESTGQKNNTGPDGTHSCHKHSENSEERPPGDRGSAADNDPGWRWELGIRHKPSMREAPEPDSCHVYVSLHTAQLLQGTSVTQDTAS